MINEAIDRFLAINYTGIKTKKDSPPVQVPAAQVPLLFIRSVVIRREGNSLAYTSSFNEAAMEMVVLVEPVRQNLQEKNYVLVRSLMEELATKFESNARDLMIIDYEIREGFEQLNSDTAYFAVIAQIRCGL